jgi:hypothetical protein
MICATCEGEGKVEGAVSPYFSDHAYPAWVDCPDCRVRVTTGPLQGQAGTIIRDESIREPGRPPCDRVWVLLDAGDNPQWFTHGELESAA